MNLSEDSPHDTLPDDTGRNIMPDTQDIDELLDAETEFRRRLARKLAARGYEGAALAQKIEELLRLEIPLRLPREDPPPL